MSYAGGTIDISGSTFEVMREPESLDRFLLRSLNPETGSYFAFSGLSMDDLIGMRDVLSQAVAAGARENPENNTEIWR